MPAKEIEVGKLLNFPPKHCNRFLHSVSQTVFSCILNSDNQNEVTIIAYSACLTDNSTVHIKLSSHFSPKK